jgi:predicted Zn finger-like uncharacterized protein
MTNSVRCPECGAELKLDDKLAGKRVRCPRCQHPFVTPGGIDELEVIETDVSEDVLPVKGLYREELPEEDDRPRRSRRSRDEDEEEDRPRRRKVRRDKDRQQASVPLAPLILGFLSCLFSCVPLLGFILGRLAQTKADEEMQRLPEGRRYHNAHQLLTLAKVLGLIGVFLSVVLFILNIVIWVKTRK